MPSSSSQYKNKKQKRGGATLSVSPGKKLREMDKRALDLEKQLSDLETNTGTVTSSAQKDKQLEQANALRVPLCETLSDIILLDPDYACRNSVTERLWRKCFYARIGRLRQRIAKEKKRNKSSTTAATLERHFFGFLSEAITLYDYLCDKLTQKLAQAIGVTTTTRAGGGGGGGGSSMTTTTSVSETYASQQQNINDNNNNSNVSQSAKGIVECLSRLYICSGDLYRYSQQTAKAQQCYETSSKLAPGYGHSYNQLGVTCQSPPDGNGSSISQQSQEVPVALTFYWYARALLATQHQSQTLTKSNIGRLIKTNQEWMQSNMNDASTSSSAAGEISSTKSMQTRRVLALLVDLHALFYMGLSSLDNKHSPITTDTLNDKIDAVVAAFTQLVNQSSLGDALLCKLVSLQAFSECFDDYGKEILGKAAAGDEARRRAAHLRTWMWARYTTLQLAGVLADRVVTGLHKLTDNHQQKSNPSNKRQVKVLSPSVRLLLPLLLVSEYLFNNNHPPTTIAVEDLPTEAVGKAENSFGSKIVQVLNLLSRLTAMLDSSLNNTAKKSKKDTSQIMDLDGDETLNQLKEYRALRGYLPFSSFVSHDDMVEGFVSEEEALEVLLRHANGSGGGVGGNTQESSGTMTGTGTQNSISSQLSHQAGDQGRIKVARFLRLGAQLASDNSSKIGNCVHRDPDGTFLWISPGQENDDDTDDNDDDIPMQVDADGDDEAGDHVSMGSQQQQQQETHTSSANERSFLFKQDTSGGPTLLVPTALLQQGSENAEKAAAPLSASHSSPMMASAKAPPASLMPNVPENASTNSAPLQNLGVPMQQTLAGAGLSSLDCRTTMVQQQPPPPPPANPPAVAPAMAPAVPPPPPGFGPPPGLRPPPPPGSVPGGQPTFEYGGGPGLSSSAMLPGFPSSTVAPSLATAPGAAPMTYNHYQPHEQQPPQQQTSTLLESLHLLGGAGDPRNVQTANPFAVAGAYSASSQPPIGALPEGNTISSTINNLTVDGGNNPAIGGVIGSTGGYSNNVDDVSFLLNPSAGDGDGASLLGSGLLSSLLGGDDSQKQNATTNNPFAT